MAMKYDLSSVEILKLLGYNEIVGKEWLENLKRKEKIELPQTYCNFMELIVDCPLFGVSDLWVGKMIPYISIPHMFYDQLQEAIKSWDGRWSTQPDRMERSLHEIADIPVSDWPNQVDNYLLIGSDYGGSMEVFAVRANDLSKNDPPVFYACL